jgi:3-hydroxybutyryl-CoA dehydrogenase
MAINLDSDDFTLGVIGAGAMGRGIVQVAAAGGLRVKLFDVNQEQSKDAVTFVSKMLDRAAEKGQMSELDAASAGDSISTIETTQGFADCQIVIEAATENPEIKNSIYADLEGIIAENAIIATNTSSLSITTLASPLKNPERFVGMHFFNPVPLMRLVEVIDGVRTDSAVGDILMELGRRMTREPVRCSDAPGFLVNQVGRGYNIEAAHIYSEQVADFPDLDRILSEGAGFRMGPFTLLDLTGLDVTHPATELIYRQFYEEPRYRPNVMMRARMEAGMLGRKSGQGFYDYSSGKQDFPAEVAYPSYDGRPVWVSKVEADGHKALSEIVSKIGGNLESGKSPSSDALILVTPIGDDVTTTAVAQSLDPTRTLGVDTLIGLATRRTIMTNPATKADFRDAAHGLLTGDGVKASVIRDCPGFVCQRIISTICNIGCQIAQLGTAGPEDIDKAVVLGLNYPNGPLTFGNQIGPKNVLQILEACQRLYGDPRYRPSLWLRRRAELGLSLFDKEI